MERKRVSGQNRSEKEKIGRRRNHFEDWIHIIGEGFVLEKLIGYGLIDHQDNTMTHFPDRFLMLFEGGAAIE